MRTKTLFLLSLLPAVWIVLLATSYYTKVDSVGFGVVRELFTIPFLLGGLVVFGMSIVAWKREKFALRSFALYALLILFTSYLFLFLS
ncbi:MAG: hypothetical protein ACKO7A_09180 [Microcystis sp.]